MFCKNSQKSSNCTRGHIDSHSMFVGGRLPPPPRIALFYFFERCLLSTTCGTSIFFAATVVCCHRLCEWQDLVVLGWDFSFFVDAVSNFVGARAETRPIRWAKPCCKSRGELKSIEILFRSWHSRPGNRHLAKNISWKQRQVCFKTLAVLLWASLLTLLCLISTIYHISNISIILRTLSTEKSWVAASWSPLGEIHEFDQVNPVSLSAVFFSR